MKSRFPSKLSAFNKLESEPNKASFKVGSCSTSNYWVRFKAPNLNPYFYTSLLFEAAAVRTEHAMRRTFSSGWENISDKSSTMPPDRHKLRLFLGWSSTNSYNSVNRLMKFSEVLLLSGKSLQICWRRSASLNVYYLSASSSHFLSSFVISLNWEGLVPS